MRELIFCKRLFPHGSIYLLFQSKFQAGKIFLPILVLITDRKRIFLTSTGRALNILSWNPNGLGDLG